MTEHHYFFEEKTKTVFYSEEYPQMDPPMVSLEDAGFEYLGKSDNPSTKMAAAVFMQQGNRLFVDGVYTAIKIRKYVEN